MRRVSDEPRRRCCRRRSLGGRQGDAAAVAPGDALRLRRCAGRCGGRRVLVNGLRPLVAVWARVRREAEARLGRASGPAVERANRERRAFVCPLTDRPIDTDLPKKKLNDPTPTTPIAPINTTVEGATVQTAGGGGDGTEEKALPAWQATPVRPPVPDCMNGATSTQPRCGCRQVTPRPFQRRISYQLASRCFGRLPLRTMREYNAPGNSKRIERPPKSQKTATEPCRLRS